MLGIPATTRPSPPRTDDSKARLMTTEPTPPTASRLASIDALRGLIMVLMLVDHVREFFYLHQQVSDPMQVTCTEPALFFTRMASHVCAPLFLVLSGLGASLYGSKAGRTKTDTSLYLMKRGALLIAMELSVVNFAWTFMFPPQIIYLQVIWAIGCSMLALSVLILLPRPAQLLLCLLLLLGHNLLDGIHFASNEVCRIPWAILHDRSLLDFGGLIKVRTSYPLLPWIGLIQLGYLCHPLFSRGADPLHRRQVLVIAGLACLASFTCIRFINTYGDKHWAAGAGWLETGMAFVNLTKYPPSLLFCLLTLGAGALVLAWLERASPWLPLVRFGSVPLFFYVFHLYALHLLYLLALALFGPNQGTRFGVPHVWQIWTLSALLLPALYWPCRWFSKIRRRSTAWWTSYV